MCFILRYLGRTERVTSKWVFWLSSSLISFWFKLSALLQYALNWICVREGCTPALCTNNSYSSEVWRFLRKLLVCACVGKLLILELECYHHRIFLFIFVPIHLRFVLAVVYLFIGYFKRNCFIRIGRKHHILIVLVWVFDLLFEGRHNSVVWLNVWVDLRVVNFDADRFFTGFRVFFLDDLVPGPSDC